MCNFDERKDSFLLNDGIRISGSTRNFKLYLNGNLALCNCFNFSYIKDSLFVTRSDNIIYVFMIGEKGKISELCKFNTNQKKRQKVAVGNCIYSINSDCKIITHRK